MSGSCASVTCMTGSPSHKRGRDSRRSAKWRTRQRGGRAASGSLGSTEASEHLSAQRRPQRSR
eukprot:1466817-Prorocentrum_lima.AAC.1